MRRFRELFPVSRGWLLLVAVAIVGVVVCWVFYPEGWVSAVRDQAGGLSCDVQAGGSDSSIHSADIVKIYGYWEDEDTHDCWFFDAEGYGLYWDALESSEMQAATGSGKFKWKYEAGTGLTRYHWQDMFVNDYVGPDHSDPSKIIALTDERMEYTTVEGEYHSFIKIMKP